MEGLSEIEDISLEPTPFPTVTYSPTVYKQPHLITVLFAVLSWLCVVSILGLGLYAILKILVVRARTLCASLTGYRPPDSATTANSESIRNSILSIKYSESRHYRALISPAIDRLNCEEGKCDESQEEEVCSICLSTFEQDDMVKELLCTHCYHSTCLDEWLSVKEFCPLCKQVAAPPSPLDEPVIEEHESTVDGENETDISPNNRVVTTRDTLESSEPDDSSDSLGQGNEEAVESPLDEEHCYFEHESSRPVVVLHDGKRCGDEEDNVPRFTLPSRYSPRQGRLRGAPGREDRYFNSLITEEPSKITDIEELAEDILIEMSEISTGVSATVEASL